MFSSEWFQWLLIQITVDQSPIGLYKCPFVCAAPLKHGHGMKSSLHLASAAGPEPGEDLGHGFVGKDCTVSPLPEWMDTA